MSSPKSSIMVGLGILALSGGFAVLAAPPASREWSAHMQAFAEALKGLLPELAHDDARDSAALRKGAQAIASLTHDLQDGALKDSPLRNDPGAKHLLDSLRRESKRAQELVESGNVAYGKAMLRGITANCVACHSRSDSGPRFSDLLGPSDLKGLDPLARAETLASVRNFDAALTEYQGIVADSDTARNNPFVWEHALRGGLALSVRVFQDPKKAQALLKGAPTAALPEFLRDQVSAWSRTLAGWKPQPKSGGAHEHLVKARELVHEAMLTQDFPADRSGDVQYLRASALLHDALEDRTQPLVAKDRAEALYLAGLSSEALQDLYLWSTHEFYFEDCVHALPSSSEAQRCYRRLESSIYNGYTGSRGTQIPKPVVEHLAELRTEAFGKTE